MLENAGVSAISVYCWGFIQKAYGLAYDYTKVFPDEPGMLVPVGHEIKKVVSIPVEIAGRLSPELGERILEEGKADLIGFGRQFFADPGFPNKIASGRQEDIVPCITCLNCVESHRLGQPLTCSVNPELGKEREYVISPTDRKKKVVVVGGGPAGMEAACVAARRGHEVVLYEESNELGGQLLLAALPPRKEVIGQLTKYLVTQVRKLGVRLELGKQATPKLIEEEKPDAVIIATGILPFTPAILGSDRNNVVRFDEVLTDKVEVEEKVVIIGGGIVGCETAEHLADEGKKVAVVEMLDRIAAAMLRTRRWQLLERLNSKGVTLLSGVICQEITEKGCVVINKEGRKETIQADTIVLATGGNPNGQLFQALKGKVSEIYRVGDCVEFRSILEAIAESYSLARKI